MISPAPNVPGMCPICSYQTMMNEALKQYTLGLSMADVVRQAIREEMNSA